MITILIIGIVFLTLLAIFASWLDTHGSAERTLAAQERRTEFYTRH